MADQNQNQGGGNNQNQNGANQNQNNGNQGGGDGGNQNQNQGGQGGDGGQQGNGEKLEAIRNADGTIVIGGKKYVDGDSYDVLAQKQRQATKEKEEREQREKAEEEKRLAEQGKFKELAESKDKEIETLKGNYTREKKVNALQAEAMKLGAVDLDAIVKLANLEDVKVSEDGAIDQASVIKVVEDLKTGKAYLFSQGGNANIGNDGGAPNGGGNGAPSFKRSQLRDHEFYKAHEKEIEQAYREGRIIDDLK